MRCFLPAISTSLSDVINWVSCACYIDYTGKSAHSYQPVHVFSISVKSINCYGFWFSGKSARFERENVAQDF